VYTTSENGWTGTQIAVGWLQEVFLPKTCTKDGRYCILILDGHCTHECTKFMWLCKQNRVELVYLPPHSSHVLQPLDVGTFGHMKRVYRTKIDRITSLNDSTPVSGASWNATRRHGYMYSPRPSFAVGGRAPEYRHGTPRRSSSPPRYPRHQNCAQSPPQRLPRY